MHSACHEFRKMDPTCIGPRVAAMLARDQYICVSVELIWNDTTPMFCHNKNCHYNRFLSETTRYLQWTVTFATAVAGRPTPLSAVH